MKTSKTKLDDSESASLVDAFETLRAWRDEEASPFMEPDTTQHDDPDSNLH